VVNVGSGEPVTVRALVTTAAELVDGLELVDFGAMPYREGDAMFLCADNARLRSETAWAADYTLEEGLQDTIASWRQVAVTRAAGVDEP
jgi:nucleoside-diphosphate-sugar epimerase